MLSSRLLVGDWRLNKMQESPKLFISYSHDNEEHKKWVLKLATDLREHLGVDVIFDQLDLRIGGDLSLFMEQGLSNASLVLCVCSEEYVRKANAGIRGTGFERMNIVQSMLNNTNVDYIIPIVRNNDSNQKTPLFLGTKLYIDFSDDSLYLSKLSELDARIFNEDMSKKPPLGISPHRKENAKAIEMKNTIEKTKYHSPAMKGAVSFNYTNNSGMFSIGTGEYEFVTNWSAAGRNSIYAYRDSVKWIGYKTGFNKIPSFNEIQSFDFTSRVRTVYVGEVVVWMNQYGNFAVTKITDVTCPSMGVEGNLSFDYIIYS